MVININHCAINTCSCIQTCLLSIGNAVVVVRNNVCRFCNTMKLKILINMEIPKKLKGDLSFHLYLLIPVHMAKAPRKHHKAEKLENQTALSCDSLKKL